MHHAIEQSVEDDEFFWSVYGKVGRQSSMLYIIVLLKYLGSYSNAAALQKLGNMMGISKGLVNDYACKGLYQELALHRFSQGIVSILVDS